MPQSYPQSVKPVEPERAPAPPSVQNAVKAMYAGAAISTVSFIVSLAGIGAFERAINPQARTSILNNAKKNHTKLTQAQVQQQIHQLDTVLIGVSIALGVLSIAAWLWMARANGQGKRWARIVSAVLFVFATFDLLSTYTQPHTLLSALFPSLTWVVGLGTVILLWRPESTEFFAPPGALK
jgi:hypothetical protein